MHKPKLMLLSAVGATLLAGLVAGCSHNDTAAQTPSSTTTASNPSSTPQNQESAKQAQFQRMMENR